MIIIQKKPNPSGAYPAPQTVDIEALPNGYAVIADTVDMAAFYAHNGFVTLTIESMKVDEIVTFDEEGNEVKEPVYIDTMTAYTPNVEAWEAWKASLPTPEEPKPTWQDQIEAQVTYTAMMTDTLLEE